MKKRILVVEDEEKLRREIELQLISAGFDVDKAASAEEGLKVVDRIDVRPRHPRASDASDALHAARAAEVTSCFWMTFTVSVP